MGQKVHPVGLRLGIIKDWQSKWYSKKFYRQNFLEDMKIRQFIHQRASHAALSRIEIERIADKIIITLYTARPGVIIGRGGREVEDLRASLEQMTKKQVSINVQEIDQPELDAQLVAENVAAQIEKRIPYARAMRQAAERTMQAGAQGVKIICSGRLGGQEIARKSPPVKMGRIPLHTLRADIDYGIAEAKTLYGNIGVKVWIYRGDVLPEEKKEEGIEKHAVNAQES